MPRTSSVRRQRPVFSLHPCASQFSDIVNFYLRTRCVVLRKVASSDEKIRAPITVDYIHVRRHTFGRVVVIHDASSGYYSITCNKKRKIKRISARRW